MEEEREFEFGEHMIKGHYKECPVCWKKFKVGDKINLCPIQKVREGWGNVVSIPVHVKCYWVEKDD